jgi:hypothetical protein
MDQLGVALPTKKAKPTVASVASEVEDLLPAIRKKCHEMDLASLQDVRQLLLDYGSGKKAIVGGQNDPVVRLVQRLLLYDLSRRAAFFIDVASFATDVAGVDPTVEEPPPVIAVAVCTFEGSEESDLSFEEGDEIEVVERHPSGWWSGRIGERLGLFPSNCTVIPAEVDPRLAIGETFLCIDNAPGLLVGDFVYVDEVLDNVGFGANLRDGWHGSIPMRVLDGVEQ